MPVHTVNDGSTVALAQLVDLAEQAGEEIVSVLSAGAGWAVVTKIKPKPGRPPKPQVRSDALLTSDEARKLGDLPPKRRGDKRA